MRKWLLGSLLTALACALLLRWTILAPEPIVVRTARVQLGMVATTVTNTKAGTVRARRRAKLSAETGGRVVAIPHREGDTVEAGTLLLSMHDATQRSQLRLATESLRAAEASHREACLARDQAERDLTRTRELAKRNIVSVDTLDQAETAHQVAIASCNAVGAEVEKARAQISVAEAELDKTVVHAPFGGIIAEVTVEVGEWITPSPPLIQAPSVIDIIDPSSLYVSAPMDEVDSAAIRAGQPARVTADSHPGREFPGRVVRVAPYVLDVEAQNRTVEIEVELDDPEAAAGLLPGTSADVEVILEVREPALRLPTSALLEGNRVLTVEDGILTERTVRIGLRNWDYAEVLAGLDRDEEVVLSLDRLEVQAGARVSVEERPDGP